MSAKSGPGIACAIATVNRKPRRTVVDTSSILPPAANSRRVFASS
jgi:hypothetical protein